MSQRAISYDDVDRVLATGKVIIEYPDDRPFPSQLILGWRSDRPIHVLVARSEREGLTYVITVYEPDPAEWDSEFCKRR